MDASVALLIGNSSLDHYDGSVFHELILGLLFPFHSQLIGGAVTVICLCL